MKVFQNPTGNSAEDEQNNKRHARRYRVYLIILAVWVAFLIILATILTPMLVLQHEDTAAEKAYRAEENALANNFTTEFRDAVLTAISAVYGIQGYIMGEMKTLPNLKSPKEERVRGQYFPTFDRYAKLVNSSASSIAVFLTAPGGVTYQFYPDKYGAALSNWDLLDEANYGPTGNWSDPASKRPTPWTSIESGKLAISGPYNTSSLPFVEHSSKPSPTQSMESLFPGKAWWIDLRQPVYQATAKAETSFDTFWGFAMAALSVDDLLEANQFVETMREANMNYTVYTNTTGTDCIVIVSSWEGVHDCTVSFMRDFIASATVHDVLGDQLSWKVAVKSSLRENRLTTNVRSAIVLSSVLGTLVVFAIVVYIIILCTRVYDGTLHAPKMAPFAMLTVGPCRGEELWELASDQMVEVKDRLGRVLARQMVRHHAYQIQQVHPLTTSYVTRTVSAAVQMAFDVIVDLQNSPIDDPLRRLLGDDGRLLLSYAVHWCNDVAVRPEHVEGGYRYEGPDMVYGGRMWVFAAPNIVTVSPTALPAAQRIPHVRDKLFDSVFLRGVTARQDLYVVWDPTNHKLREAEACAAEQVRRARLAQREMAELKSSDADPHKRRLTYSFNQNGYDSSDLDIGSFSGRPRMNGSNGHANGRALSTNTQIHNMNNHHSNNSSGSAGYGTSHTGSSSANNSDHSMPPGALRSRATVAAAVKRDNNNNNNNNVTGVKAGTVPPFPTSVVVPSSPPTTATAGRVSGKPATGVVTAPNPFAFPTSPAKSQERRMVRRPAGCCSDSSSCEAAEVENNGGLLKDANSRSNSRSDDEVGEGEAAAAALCLRGKMTEIFVEGHTEGDHRSQQEPQQPPTQTARLLIRPYGPCAGPLPALPPISNTQRSPATLTATTSTNANNSSNTNNNNNTNVSAAALAASSLAVMSSRRVLDTLYTGGPCAAASNSAAVSSSNSNSNNNLNQPGALNTTANATTATVTPNALVANARYGDGVLSAKPLVVVPPSAELAAAAAAAGSAGHGMSSKSSSGTPSSDGVVHGRRTTVGPASSYDNPLAHNLAAGVGAGTSGMGPGAGGTGGGGGVAADGEVVDASGVRASAPLVAVASFASDGDPLADSQVSLDTFSSDLLLRPAISVQADHLLRAVFDRQAVALDISYDSVRVLVYYFYSSYKILFRPLAAPERHNIYRRLMTAFGVPQQGILEHLAARCAIRFLQRHEETQTLMWDQQRRLQMHARSTSGPTTASASVSDDAAHSSSN